MPVTKLLPVEFQSFLTKNGIKPEEYLQVCQTDYPRFIRMNPRNGINIEEFSQQIKEANNVKNNDETSSNHIVCAKTALPNFYQLPGKYKIQPTKAYKNGQVYGIDLASGVAVYCLGLKETDHVLDLCAAPGAKLCLIADLIAQKKNKNSQKGKQGTVTGVDISTQRLNVTHNLVQKYGVQNVRLFRGDGINFNAEPPTAPLKECTVQDLSSPFFTPVKKVNTKKRKQAHTKESKKKLKMENISLPSSSSLVSSSPPSNMISFSLSSPSQVPLSPVSLLPSPSLSSLYDKVLVDAECTHDGSIKHIMKYNEWGWETFQRRVLNPERIQSLRILQQKLLQNGFKLLKPGGTLVYSTCSFCRTQNEDIVQWLLQREPTALLVPIQLSFVHTIKPQKNKVAISTSAATTTAASNIECQDIVAASGFLPHTLRFDPLLSATSGLFVAKIRKASHMN